MFFAVVNVSLRRISAPRQMNGWMMKWSIVPMLLLLIGCGGSHEAELEAENEELRTRVSELEGQLDNAREEVENLQSSAASLSDEVSRFDSENWSDVVPDVQASADDVQGATDSAEAALSD